MIKFLKQLLCRHEWGIRESYFPKYSECKCFKCGKETKMKIFRV